MHYTCWNASRTCKINRSSLVHHLSSFITHPSSLNSSIEYYTTSAPSSQGRRYRRSKETRKRAIKRVKGEGIFKSGETASTSKMMSACQRTVPRISRRIWINKGFHPLFNPNYSFSTETATVATELTFGTPRVESLFHRMTALPKTDVSRVAALVLTRCGHDPVEIKRQKNEAAAAPVQQAAAAEVAPVVEKTIFDLKLISFDPKAKIKVIKEVRAITGLGLKEAKELVEGAPKVIQKGIKKEEAEKLSKLLEEIGAVMEIL